MLRDKLKGYKIILASGSPRRQQFFNDLDIDFEIRLKDIEEIYPDELQGLEITNYLAQLKSNAFEGEIAANEILITSDTIVWLNSKALGKPKDYDDAFAILKSLSNETHEVITSVCFKTIKKTETRKIDKIIINGYENFPSGYLSNYLQLKNNSIFNRTKLNKSSDLINTLPFVSEIKPPEILFTKDSTIVYLFLKKDL